MNCTPTLPKKRMFSLSHGFKFEKEQKKSVSPPLPGRKRECNHNLTEGDQTATTIPSRLLTQHYVKVRLGYQHLLQYLSTCLKNFHITPLLKHDPSTDRCMKLIFMAKLHLLHVFVKDNSNKKWGKVYYLKLNSTVISEMYSRPIGLQFEDDTT